MTVIGSWSCVETVCDRFGGSINNIYRIGRLYMNPDQQLLKSRILRRYMKNRKSPNSRCQSFCSIRRL